MSESVILVVGDVNSWIEAGRDLPTDSALKFKDFKDFKAETLLKIRPELVLAPLTAREFDALDVAARLQAFQYRGAFRVLTPRLPNMEMVTRELRERAPDVDCELLEIATTRPLQML